MKIKIKTVMKAKLLLLFMLLFAYAYAHEQSNVLVQESKTEITKEQLPEAVATAMEQSDYAAWTVGKIYEVAPQQEGGTKLYEIHVTGDDKTIALTYDPEGNLLKAEEQEG